MVALDTGAAAERGAVTHSHTHTGLSSHVREESYGSRKETHRNYHPQTPEPSAIDTVWMTFMDWCPAFFFLAEGQLSPHPKTLECAYNRTAKGRTGAARALVLGSCPLAAVVARFCDPKS